MAYGDEQTKLANFEENIDASTFEDLTSITINEFRQLRDGFEYVDEKGETKVIPGLFNDVVFNASIKEFLDTKQRLANYFDDSMKEDIFDYIPPQKTNQIFTPKVVVKYILDMLERESPDIFKDPTKKFIDLYTKSGLFLTEITKRLFKSLENEISNEDERLKHILENQVYGVAPTNIIYNIAKKYIYSDFYNISTDNLIECDLTSYAKKEL